MPKRTKAAQAQQQPEPEQPAADDEEQLQAEDLDLSSDDSLLGDEADSESGEGGQQSGDQEQSDDSADEDIREALAQYLEAANAQRPADAVGDAEQAETSGRMHK